MLKDNTEKPIFRSRIFAPLLWLLVPIILGYTIQHTFPKTPPHQTLIYLALLGITFFSYLWIIQKHHQYSVRAIGVIAIILMSWTYSDYRLRNNHIFPHFPEREANLTIQIEEVKNTKDKYSRYNAYGKIIDTPLHLQFLRKQKAYLFLSSSYPLIKSQVIKAKGVITSLENSENAFDQFLIAKGIGIKLSRGKVIEVIQKETPIEHFFVTAKHQLESILRKNFFCHNEAQTNIYSGMLLGNKSTLEASQKLAFQRTGSLHFFAISGLHVGVIAATLAYILALIRTPPFIRAGLGLTILLAYVLITGASPSSIRAFLMVTFYWGATALFRKKSPFSALAGSAFLVLILFPEELWNIGFQLSYAVVASILLYGLPLSEYFFKYIEGNLDWHPIVKKIANFLLSLFSISLAANIASISLSLLYFDNFAPGALPLSMLLVPLASIVVSLGCVSIILGLLYIPLLPNLLNDLAALSIKLMETAIFYSLNFDLLFQIRILSVKPLAAICLFAFLVFCLHFHLQNRLNSKLLYIVPPVLIPILLITFSQ